VARDALSVAPDSTADGAARRRLVLVRHAKSSWDDPSLSDHERPLAGRGRKALDRMRAHLEHRGIRPEVVLCSSARRTRQTLDGIREAFGRDAVIEIDNGLYGASAGELAARLTNLDDGVRTAVVIAHNPGIEELVALLADFDDAVPTGAIAELSFEGSWRVLASAAVALDDFWRPRPPR